MLASQNWFEHLAIWIQIPLWIVGWLHACALVWVGPYTFAWPYYAGLGLCRFFSSRSRR